MRDILETATSYPVVPFTVLLLTSLGYWVVSTVVGLGDFGMDTDLELDVGSEGPSFDAEPAIDIDGVDGTDAGESMAVASLIAATGIGVAPLSVVLSAFSFAAWFMATMIVTIWGSPGGLVSTAIVVASGFIGLLFAGRAARLLRPLFTVVTATTHRQLVGKVCEIRTGTVTESFGQAEVVQAGDDHHLVQVRCPEPNELAAGDKALIVDVDDGIFTISSDIDLARSLD